MKGEYRRYALDTILSVVFWVTVIVIWSSFVVKLDGGELVNILIGTAVINASLGALYGRLLNKWRKAFNYI